jgi:hypothetical protein
MFDTFTVRRRSVGLVASLEADRMAQDFDGGAEDAGASDGSQPSSDNAHLDDGDGAGYDDGTVQGDAGRTAAAQDDDEEFDDEDDQNADPQERVKKLQNALKKAKRKLGSSRGDRQFLKELRDTGLRPTDLYADSREYRRLMDLARKNPRVMAALNGSDAPDPSADRGRADRRDRPTDDDFQFDESAEALGFDPKESRANRMLADGLKRTAKLEHQLTGLLKRLNPDALLERVDNIDRGLRNQSQAQTDKEWNTAFTAAASKITDPDMQKAFGDLIRAAKHMDGGRRPAQFYVDHYLKLLKVNPGQAQRASDAARAANRGRVAERVAQLPRQGHQGTTAAPARRQRESLADVHKRIKTLGGTGSR